MYLLVSVLVFALVIAALVDIITRQDGQAQHLPKLVWILLVVLLPVIGSILWFAVGREYSTPVNLGSFGDPRRREDPDSFRGTTTEQELAALDREIAFHEKQAEIDRLEAKLHARRPAED